MQAKVLLVAGIVVMVVGYTLTHLWGGVVAIQTAGSPEEFVRLAESVEGGLQRAFWADILILVPGYTMFFLGAFALRRPRAPGLCRWGWRLALGGAILDQVQNVMILFGLSGVDSGSAPSDTTIVLSLAVVTGAFLLLGLAILLVIIALTRRGEPKAVSG